MCLIGYPLSHLSMFDILNSSLPVRFEPLSRPLLYERLRVLWLRLVYSQASFRVIHLLHNFIAKRLFRSGPVFVIAFPSFCLTKYKQDTVTDKKSEGIYSLKKGIYSGFILLGKWRLFKDFFYCRYF